ncbi:MAG: ribonuclease P protein component [Marinobacter maritimus]|jgi:ribonuclease P protein component|uniref:ribonuclease P protein component n=1 Tax=Marinobacter maritimus TaxID=277961 RepID=UPI000BD9C75A|nr:ribonuclease P protein component [Marinobacter maritimus]MBL1271968.1 ribonuclease P protein component [Oceanospirillales bacterium]|tara:strand:- start:1755 stop:2162 length:408 start_codon:yes stop_codon:yes gene_type:complete
MKALNFPKSHRLLRPADYGKVFNDVQLKVPHKNFLILATPNNLGHARIGLVFAKKNLKLSVQRNRIKRQVRETFRHQPELPGMDIIILGRQGLAAMDNQAVRLSLNGLWQRLAKKYHQLPTSKPAVSSSAGEGTG